MVSAPVVARERGIHITETRKDAQGAFGSYMRLIVTTEAQTRSVAGTIYSDGKPRFIQIKGINLEAEPMKFMLYTTNTDTPGLYRRARHQARRARHQHRHLRPRPRAEERRGDRAARRRRGGRPVRARRDRRAAANPPGQGAAVLIRAPALRPFTSPRRSRRLREKTEGGEGDARRDPQLHDRRRRLGGLRRRHAAVREFGCSRADRSSAARPQHPIMGMPAGYMKYLAPGLPRDAPTVPQPQLGGRAPIVPVAKALGGGTSVNAMVYMRGQRRTTTAGPHPATGDPGGAWSYDELLPVFHRHGGQRAA